MTTDFDLDRLGDVWRQQPDPAEMEKLKRSAASVSRRARWAQLFDIAAAVAVAAVVLFIVFAYPQRTTVLMGSAAILVLLYGNIRSRRIRQLELRSLAGTTENMLDQSIERLEATLKHNRITLIAFGPAILVGLLFAASANLSSGHGLVFMIRSFPMLRVLLGVGGLAAIAGFAIFLVLSIRRARRELQRLAAMRDSFRQERESSNY
jgi:L-asparagine transporter-like permease